MQYSFRANGYEYTIHKGAYTGIGESLSFIAPSTAGTLLNELMRDIAVCDILRQVCSDIHFISVGALTYQIADRLAEALYKREIIISRAVAPDNGNAGMGRSLYSPGVARGDSSHDYSREYAEQVRANRAEFKENLTHVEVAYQYADGKPIENAEFTVFDQNSKQVAKGQIGPGAYIHRWVPNSTTKVRVEFHNDPVLEKYLVEPKVNKEQARVKPGWLERMWSGIESAGAWTWGVLQGDYNEDPTMGQIVFNTILTMVPLVDQAADIRDISKSLHDLIWKRRYDDYAVWVSLGFVLIGLVPTFGSLAKGILKSIWRKVPVAKVAAYFNHFAKGHFVKYIRRLDLDDLNKKVNKQLRDILSELSRNINKLKSSSYLKPLHDRLDKLSETMRMVNQRIDGMLNHFFGDLKKSVDAFLDATGHRLAVKGAPNSKVSYKQVAQEPPRVNVDGNAQKVNVGPKITTAKTKPDAPAAIPDQEIPKYDTPHKPLSPQKRADLKEKLDNRTITRDEYQQLEWDRKFSNRRNRGVSRFWAQERRKLRAGEPGTRNWSPEQRDAILKGKRPKFDGDTLEGHHKHNALDHPQIADDSKNIYPATKKEHLERWHGGNFQNDTVGKPLKPNALEEF